MILTLGIVFILSAINVYVQDIEFAVQFVINMGFYATPILYSMSLLPEGNILTTLISLNPITVLVNAYRDIFLYHAWPDPMGLLYVLVLSFVVLIVGYLIFGKLEKGFAEQF